MQISSTTASEFIATTPDAGRVPVQVLDQQDFLKLLVAQLTSQDPLDPKADTEFIAQMAQFSSLEQAKAMQEDMARLQASNLIGRAVELKDADGEMYQGTVTAVQVDAGTPRIVVNGQAYDLGAVRLIEPATNP